MKEIFLSAALLSLCRTEACEQLLENVAPHFVPNDLGAVPVDEALQESFETQNIGEIGLVDENFERSTLTKKELLRSMVSGGMLSAASCGMFGLFSLCKDYFYNSSNVTARGVVLSLGLFSFIGGGVSMALGLKECKNAYNYFN